MCVLGTRAVVYKCARVEDSEYWSVVGQERDGHCEGSCGRHSCGRQLLHRFYGPSKRVRRICLRSNCADLRDGIAGKSIFHNIQNCLSFQLSNAAAAAALTLITLSTTLCRSCSSTPSWMVSNFAFSQISNPVPTYPLLRHPLRVRPRHRHIVHLLLCAIRRPP